MSVRHIGLVLDHLDAPPPVKLIALILADHSDADGFCWPSYRRIAERSCLAERTVRRYVRELIDAGVVTKVRTGHVTTKDGRRIRLTNAYRVNADALEAHPSLLSSADVSIVAAHDHLQLAASGHPRWSHTATKSSLEPSDLTVSAAEPVDNPSQPTTLPGLGEQIGSFKRAGDVLRSMDGRADRAGRAV